MSSSFAPVALTPANIAFAAQVATGVAAYVGFLPDTARAHSIVVSAAQVLTGDPQQIQQKSSPLPGIPLLQSARLFHGQIVLSAKDPAIVPQQVIDAFTDFEQRPTDTRFSRYLRMIADALLQTQRAIDARRFDGWNPTDAQSRSALEMVGSCPLSLFGWSGVSETPWHRFLNGHSTSYASLALLYHAVPPPPLSNADEWAAAIETIRRCEEADGDFEAIATSVPETIPRPVAAALMGRNDVRLSGLSAGETRDYVLSHLTSAVTYLGEGDRAPLEAARARARLALELMHRGSEHESVMAFAEARIVYQRAGDNYELLGAEREMRSTDISFASTWDWQGNEFHQGGEFSDAVQYYDAALTLHRRTGHLTGIGATLIWKAMALEALDMKHEAALARLEAAEVMQPEYALQQRAAAAVLLGNYDRFHAAMQSVRDETARFRANDYAALAGSSVQAADQGRELLQESQPRLTFSPRSEGSDVIFQVRVRFAQRRMGLTWSTDTSGSPDHGGSLVFGDFTSVVTPIVTLPHPHDGDFARDALLHFMSDILGVDLARLSFSAESRTIHVRGGNEAAIEQAVLRQFE